MKLSVNYSEKRGLPRFGSHGACCSVEIELPQEILQSAAADLRLQLRALYATCRQAVRDELQNSAGDDYGGEHGGAYASVSSTAPDVVREPTRLATASQIRVLQSLAQRSGLNLATESDRRFQRPDVAALTIQQASQLIDQLKLSRVG